VGADTKDTILDAAEALFARQGFANTSLRAITAAAGVNLASVNYHFGSKDALIEAVFGRRLLPMNRERIRRLEALEEEYGEGAPLGDLIAAFVGPALELSRDTEWGGARFIQLLGRSYTEPSLSLQAQVRGMYEEVIGRFKSAFGGALPELPSDELYWRLHFMVGVLAYCMAGTDMMRLIASCRLADSLDADVLKARLVAFLVAGLRAPVPGPLERPVMAGPAREGRQNGLTT